MVWLQLAICIAIILFFGRRVAIYGDIIAVKTKLGGLWIGLVLISITTSLPELFTGVSAILIVDAPGITIGNLLGANTFNLLNLAFLDIAYKNHGSIMSVTGRGHIRTVWYGFILVSIVALSIAFQPVGDYTLGWVGWTTPVIILLYLFFVYRSFVFEKQNTSPDLIETQYEQVSMRKTLINFSIAAVFIIGAGIWLAAVGDQIAETTGLGANFVGSLFIAFTTTLPEITVSYSALRLGAVDLAVSNMLGSNMFNMFLVCIDDLMYTRGSILGAVSPTTLVTAVTILVLMLITLAALYSRPPRKFRLSWYSLAVISVFVLGAYLTYLLSS